MKRPTIRTNHWRNAKTLNSTRIQIIILKIARLEVTAYYIITHIHIAIEYCIWHIIDVQEKELTKRENKHQLGLAMDENE